MIVFIPFHSFLIKSNKRYLLCNCIVYVYESFTLLRCCDKLIMAWWKMYPCISLRSCWQIVIKREALNVAVNVLSESWAGARASPTPARCRAPRLVMAASAHAQKLHIKRSGPARKTCVKKSYKLREKLTR